MASKKVVHISKRLSLVKSQSRDSWPYSADPNRVLVLFLPWLNCKEKHVKKYTDVYSNMGLDVLCMKSNIMDFLWPPQSLKAGGDLIKVLQEHCKGYNHLVLHSMSVGAYNLTSFRMLVDEQESSRYLADKFTGIVYDSAVIGAGDQLGLVKSTGEENGGEKSTDAIELMVTGMAKSVSDSKLLFSIVNPLAKIYFAAAKSKTIDYYIKAYDFVREQPLKAPTVFFASKNDPMSDHKVVKQLSDIWKKDHSLPVRVQMWDKSRHAQHLSIHTKEYLNVLRQFMSDQFENTKQ